MEELVAVARVVKPRGLKGEVIADVRTDFPERFEGLSDVTGVKPDGERLGLKIEKHWFQQARLVLKFTGYDSVEAAEDLRNTEICIAEDQAVKLDTDEFYDWQLVGCNVETNDGTSVGIVTDVMRTGPNELLVVAGQGKEHLIPFAAAICTEVDLEGKLIRIDPPEGLLDF